MRVVKKYNNLDPFFFLKILTQVADFKGDKGMRVFKSPLLTVDIDYKVQPKESNVFFSVNVLKNYFF